MHTYSEYGTTENTCCCQRQRQVTPRGVSGSDNCVATFPSHSHPSTNDGSETPE